MRHRSRLSSKLLLMVLMLIFSQAHQLKAGQLSIAIGDSVGAVPTGEYVDLLDDISISKSIRWGVKYFFDSGLIIGREEFSAAHSIDDGTDTNVLVITAKGYTLGWAFGEEFQFIIEAAIPENATVSVRESEFDIFNGDMLISDSAKSSWFGIAVDWGFMNKDSSGLGINFLLRQANMKSDDLFGSGKTFDGSGLYFAGSLRYRF